MTQNITVDKRFTQDTTEYKKLQVVATMLTLESPNGFKYIVGNCWEDYGAGFMWTTIIRDENGWGCNGVQVLSPREWEEIVYFAQTAADLAKCVNDIRSDKFFRDK